MDPRGWAAKGATDKSRFLAVEAFSALRWSSFVLAWGAAERAVALF